MGIGGLLQKIVLENSKDLKFHPGFDGRQECSPSEDNGNRLRRDQGCLTKPAIEQDWSRIFVAWTKGAATAMQKSTAFQNEDSYTNLANSTSFSFLSGQVMEVIIFEQLVVQCFADPSYLEAVSVQ